MPLKQHGFKQRQHETQLFQEFQDNSRESLAMKLSQVPELQCNECHIPNIWKNKGFQTTKQRLLFAKVSCLALLIFGMSES